MEAAPAENPTNTVFYLPHQAAKKEKYGKIKWRIVFDASSHESNAHSLNEVLEMGPNICLRSSRFSSDSDCTPHPSSVISHRRSLN